MKRLLIKLLPASAITGIKAWLARINVRLIRLFASNGFLASLYYTFFSRQFYREHKAVLQGRLQYEKSLRAIGQSCVLLRRNIHRLEKGLIMQPRRDVFAEAYIGETVSCYLDAIQSTELCAEERKWATDVLSDYFRIAGASKKIDAARARFEGHSNMAQPNQSVPYPHQALPACPVDYAELLTLFKRRRSVRWYQPKAVPEELIRQAVQAATLAPSACNRQPFEFYVVNEAEKAAGVARCAMGTVGFAENLQCVIAVVGDLSAYPAERDRHVIYIDGALASMQLMLACETLGLSTCPINWPDIEQREQMLSKQLGLAYHQRTVMLLAVGYAQPEGGIPFSQKKTDQLLIKEVN
ncbi:nitroreductase family protein [Alkalimonas collagenimarina]|uniref:Nitroreductase family protein n=1 Tax=Alkalimonas collagenimarina TaxID=400390 RepID=A0ABT9H0R4_9GAMM|nr:nitroreductase family protein [Alkalimonas collagenimarina]MDP4536907.1 nitroreductase family protein [Alkalimonas collagenimarina]